MELKRYVLVLKNNYRNNFKDEIDLIDTKDDLLQEKLSKYKHEAETGYKRWYGYTTRKTRKNSKETYLAYNDGGRYRDESVNMVGKIIKTSDNTLDFVEMADLIEVDYLNGILDSRGNEIRVHKIYLVQLVTKDVSGKTHIVIDMKEDGNIDVKKDYIVAIYKRQPNGDYKKYEVK